MGINPMESLMNGSAYFLNSIFRPGHNEKKELDKENQRIKDSNQAVVDAKVEQFKKDQKAETIKDNREAANEEERAEDAKYEQDIADQQDIIDGLKETIQADHDLLVQLQAGNNYASTGYQVPAPQQQAYYPTTGYQAPAPQQQYQAPAPQQQYQVPAPQQQYQAPAPQQQYQAPAPQQKYQVAASPQKAYYPPTQSRAPAPARQPAYSNHSNQPASKTASQALTARGVMPFVHGEGEVIQCQVPNGALTLGALNVSAVLLTLFLMVSLFVVSMRAHKRSRKEAKEMAEDQKTLV